MKHQIIIALCFLAIVSCKKDSSSPAKSTSTTPTHYDSTHFNNGAMKIPLWEGNYPKDGDTVWVPSFQVSMYATFGFVSLKPKPGGSNLYHTLMSNFQDFHDTIKNLKYSIIVNDGPRTESNGHLISKTEARVGAIYWKIYYPDSAAVSDTHFFYFKVKN